MPTCRHHGPAASRSPSSPSCASTRRIARRCSSWRASMSATRWRPSATACASSWSRPRTIRARWCSTRCSPATPPSPAHRESAHAAWFREARAPYGVEAARARAAPGGARLARGGPVRDAGPVRAPRAPGAAGARPGFEVRWNDRGRILTEAELIERLDGVVGHDRRPRALHRAGVRGRARRSRSWRAWASATSRSTSPPPRATASPSPWRSAPITMPWPTTPWR